MMSLLDRAPRLVALSLFASLLAAASARADATFSFADTPGRLPKTVVPIHYSIDLRPDLEKSTLAGSELVDIEVREATDRVVLNALNLTVDTAAIEGESAQAAITADTAAQTVTLTFPRPISAGRHQLRLGFSAQINKFGRGLYAVEYPTSEGRKRLISSQLEPADARRIFPCWDEPAFKASFELTVTVPERFLAVSNMPVAREQPAGGGLKRVSFQPTPRMSTYLFVLVAGELERLSTQAEGVTVSVVATLGKSAQGRFALDSAVSLLRYFNDYFGVNYPLPKLDLIAVPGGFSGAMENWGGITFFESRLLFDAGSNAPEAQRGIFGILAHEMAHQWFGDLVTMAWWDDIWLNEGFASWMQAKSADVIHPEWQVWLTAGEAKQRAMNDDAQRTTHPIQKPVANETEAMALFDSITYNKGQAFIRMLESYLGEDNFRAGIRQYMKQHAYSNSVTADLWRALEAASAKPVAKIAGGFTEQAGLPIVIGESTCVGGEQRVKLRQERFTVHDPDPKPERWQVPIAVGPLRALRPAETVLLGDDGMEFKAGACGEPIKLNLGDVGYFRVQYDQATLAALTRSLADLSPADRVNLLADNWALVEAGRSAPTGYLELVDKLGSDDQRAIWDQVIRIFNRLDFLERGRPGRAAFQAYARAKLHPVFDRLGWDQAPGERVEIGQLRVRLIRTLGNLGDEEIVAEAKRRFAAFLKEPASLRPSLRPAVTHLVGRRVADRATYDTLLALARKATNTDERVRYYSALGAALDPALAEATLALTLTDELPANLRGTLLGEVASEGEHPDLALTFVRAHFDELAAKQGPQFRTTFVSYLMRNFADRARAEELAQFAPVHETSGGRIVAERAREAILADADFRDGVLPGVDDWIKRHPARQ